MVKLRLIIILLKDLLINTAVMGMCVGIYAILDRIALDILYGKGVAQFDRDYYIDRLVSIAVINAIPIFNIVFLTIMMWTFEYRVEAFTWSIWDLANKKRGVIVRKESAKEWKGYH